MVMTSSCRFCRTLFSVLAERTNYIWHGTEDGMEDGTEAATDNIKT